MTDGAPTPSAPPTTAADALPAPRGLRAVLAAMIFAAALTVAYWAIWFLVDRSLLASSASPAYFTFENAFPAADAWLVLTLILATLGVARRRASGLFWTLLAGGAGIYLGCMDVLFDLENGIYAIRPGADASGPLVEIVINILTFTLGISIIAWAWRNRRWLLTA
jgi:hypothetical protein